MRRYFLDRIEVPLERGDEVLLRVPAERFPRRVVRREETRIARDHRIADVHELDAKILRREAAEYRGYVVEVVSLAEGEVMHDRQRENHLALKALVWRRNKRRSVANQ